MILKAHRLFVLLLVGLMLISGALMARAEGRGVCAIEVVDEENGWPVPLVELRTVHGVRLVSDNAGMVAFDLPELMGHETWLEVIGQGYEVAKDGFGNRGVRVTPEAGKTIRIKVKRTGIAKRLGRITGAGLFAESQKLGRDLDWRESGVLGSDTVQNAVYHGRMFWLWGDTKIARYPLGVFDSSSATSELKPVKSFEPPLKLLLDYFTNANGSIRGVAKMAGDGPTWITAYVVLPDAKGVEHLAATYLKVRNHLEVYEKGLCLWDDTKEEFEPLRKVWVKSSSEPKAPTVPEGHPMFWKDDAGVAWVLFGNPLPVLKCRATLESWEDSSSWQVIDSPKSLVSASDGTAVKLHSGSAAWNAWRKRWIAIFMQSGGKPSPLGEIWYAEAKSPFGPWGKAVKVLSHDNYTFYNPRIHPEFTPEDSPVLLFEGTYTQEFSNHPEPTPRYDYNQILYRLDLDDPRLAPGQEK